jgi:hypothetical protein
MPTLTATPAISICEHAARRWAERVRQDPSMPACAARRDLERCTAHAQMTDEAPSWLAVDQSEPGARYLLVGPDVAVVLRPERAGDGLAAVTVMTAHDQGSVHAARCRNRRRSRHEKTRSARRPARSYA